MNTQEMLQELNAIKRRIAMLPQGSVLIGELMQAYAALVDSYIAVTEAERKKAA